MENTTLTSNNLTTDKSFNGTTWRPLNSHLNDELVFEVAQKNNISISLSKLLINRKVSKIPNFLNSKLKDNISFNEISKLNNINKIISFFKKKNQKKFTCLDLVNLIKKNKNFLKINQKVKRTKYSV